MKRRPFFVLSLAFAAAALMHVMLSSASPRVAEGEGTLPPGMVCTTCGPIPSAICELQPTKTLPPLTSLPRYKPKPSDAN